MTYTITTLKPTEGPWRVTAWGNRYAEVTFADGRRFFVGVERTKAVRIPYKPRGQNRGWRHAGFVNDERGTCLWSGDVAGSQGVRGLLRVAGLLDRPSTGEGDGDSR